MISDTGDWLLFIALPIVVYQLTGSAVGTSVAFLVELTPGIVLAPMAGWCVDRWNRRRLLTVVTGLQAAALVPLLVAPARAGLLPVVYVVILAEAALSTLFDPAKNALLPALVPGDDLVRANSLVGLAQNLARLVGGPLGGVLLAIGGLRVVAAAGLLSYAIAGSLIARIAAPASTRTTDAGRTPAAGRDAYRSLLHSRPIRGALVVTLVSQIAQGIFVVLFILFVAQRLHGGSDEIGLLRGVQAIGAIAGGVALAAFARHCGPRTVTATAAITFGAVDLLLWNASSVSTSAALYVTLFIVVGAPGIALDTGLISAVQLAVADPQRGRAFAAFGLTSNVGQAAGMLAGGLLATPVGLLHVLNGQAVLYLIAGGLAAWMMSDRESRTAPETQVSAPTPE